MTKKSKGGLYDTLIPPPVSTPLVYIPYFACELTVCHWLTVTNVSMWNFAKAYIIIIGLVKCVSSFAMQDNIVFIHRYKPIRLMFLDRAYCQTIWHEHHISRISELILWYITSDDIEFAKKHTAIPARLCFELYTR
jgi:hypothetical protein